MDERCEYRVFEVVSHVLLPLCSLTNIERMLVKRQRVVVTSRNSHRGYLEKQFYSQDQVAGRAESNSLDNGLQAYIIELKLIHGTRKTVNLPRLNSPLNY